MAEQVTLREVGLRDGIQMAKSFLATKHKLDWAVRSRDAGIREIELTSFVPAKVVPQFSDADELAKNLSQLSGVVASALVPNLKGAERAIAAGFTHINYVLSISELHSQSNVRRSTDEAIEEFKRIVVLKQTEAGKIWFWVSVLPPVSVVHCKDMSRRNAFLKLQTLLLRAVRMN